MSALRGHRPRLQNLVEAWLINILLDDVSEKTDNSHDDDNNERSLKR